MSKFLDSLIKFFCQGKLFSLWIIWLTRTPVCIVCLFLTLLPFVLPFNTINKAILHIIRSVFCVRCLMVYWKQLIFGTLFFFPATASTWRSMFTACDHFTSPPSSPSSIVLAHAASRDATELPFLNHIRNTWGEGVAQKQSWEESW